MDIDDSIMTVDEAFLQADNTLLDPPQAHTRTFFLTARSRKGIRGLDSAVYDFSEDDLMQDSL